MPKIWSLASAAGVSTHPPSANHPRISRLKVAMLGNKLAALDQLPCPAAQPQSAPDSILETVTPESSQRTKIDA
jgi:hypothetical protein